MLWTRRISMKNHRFPWLRNRTTDNRKCEKARNIKEKRTIEMFSTVWKQLEELRSSASDNLRDGHEPCDIKYKKLCPCLHGAELFYLMSWGEARDREKPEVFEGRKANGRFLVDKYRTTREQVQGYFWGWFWHSQTPDFSLVLEPGGIDHSESGRNNQSELIRNSQCTCLAN